MRQGASKDPIQSASSSRHVRGGRLRRPVPALRRPGLAPGGPRCASPWTSAGARPGTSTSALAGSEASGAGLVEVEAEVPDGTDGGCSGLHPPLLRRLVVAAGGGHWGSVGGFAVVVVACAWMPWTTRARDEQQAE
jgi:hypothetical protein